MIEVATLLVAVAQLIYSIARDRRRDDKSEVEEPPER